MSQRSIKLSNDRYERLIEAARAHGFEIKAGPGSQLGLFIEWLLDNMPQPPDARPDGEWSAFIIGVLPHANELARALGDRGKGLKMEAGEGRCLFEEEGEE